MTDHGWERWTEQVDWTDWRSWLRKVASTDRASPPWPSGPWEQAAAPGGISLTLRAVGEDELGRHLTATWPAFRRWWRDGPGTRPTAGQAGARLDEHMPELVPAWRRLTGLLGDDPEAAAMLALWNPPPFLTSCSQAAVLPGGPALIRNYDWDHRLFDAVVARTALTGPRVLGMLDCMWGLLDGVNDAGLAVSLAFGGRPQVGEGFGIPLVVRYVLETCGSTEEAMRTLRRLPVHMSYNVTTVDRDGRRATAYLAPDRPAHVTGQASSGSVTCKRSSMRAAARPTWWRPACARRCTPPGSARVSAPCIPPSTARPRASLPTTGRAAPGSTPWSGSGPAASRSGSDEIRTDSNCDHTDISRVFPAHERG